MKTICTLSFARTGSTFFQDHFESIDDYSHNFMEFFNDWPGRHLYTIERFYFKRNAIPSNAYRNFLHNFIVKYYDNLRINPEILLNAENRKQHLVEYNIHTIDLFLDAVSRLKELKYEYCFYKIIPNIFCKDDWIPSIVNVSDICIIWYRRSVLDVYISLKKAMQTNIWISSNQYDPLYDNKIMWNLQEFIGFAEEYRQSYNTIQQSIHDLQKPYCVICYEDFCNQVDKLSYLKQTLSMNLPLKASKVSKQSLDKPQADNFHNAENFLQDQRLINDISTLNIESHK